MPLLQNGCVNALVYRKMYSLFLYAVSFLGFPASSGFLDEQCYVCHIEESQRKRLLYTCCFPTIGFVVLTIGEVLFHSLKIGFLLYAAQLLSGLTLLFITRSTPVYADFPHPNKTQTSFSLLSDAIKESGITLFMIGGYLMVFMSISTLFFFNFCQKQYLFLYKSFRNFPVAYTLYPIFPAILFKTMFYFPCF